MSIVLVQVALAHNQDDPDANDPHSKGYHLHVWDYATNQAVILTCRNVKECHDQQEQWLLNTDTGYDGCAGQSVQQNQTNGPNKQYFLHWWIRTLAQCDAGNGGYGTDMAYTFTWYLDDIPSECDKGVSNPVCPGWVLDEPPEPPYGCDESNPCNPANGVKTQTESDFAADAIGGLRFHRYYSSKGPFRSGANMAPGWRHSYSRSLDELPDRREPILLGRSIRQSGVFGSESSACTDGWDEIKATAFLGSYSTGMLQRSIKSANSEV